VVVASNGREALNLAEEQDFEMIFMDIQMPLMDGFEASRRIKANPRLAGLPIVAMTAHVFPEERQRIRAGGMDDYVFKPIDPEEVYRVLNRWLQPQACRVIGPGGDSGNDGLPVLQDMDVRGGVARFLGDRDAYFDTLLQARREYAQAMSVVEGHLERGELQEAGIYVHTLLGVCGNLGAVKVVAAARDFERALHDGSGPERDALFTALRVCFETMLHEIDRVRYVKHGEPARQDLDTAGLARLLEDLMPGLRSRTPKKCQGVADTLLNANIPPVFKDDVARVCALMDQYNYSPALTLVEMMLEKINGGR
jgi:CheY-like chemotaxis protein